MVTRDRVVALLFLAGFIGYGFAAQNIPLYFGSLGEGFTARTFPTFLAWGGGIVSLILLVMPSGKPSVDNETLRGFDWLRVGLFIVLMVAYGLTIKTVGFLVSTTLFLLLGFLILGERRVAILALASLPVAAGFQFILHGLLGIYISDPLLLALGIIQ